MAADSKIRGCKLDLNFEASAGGQEWKSIVFRNEGGDSRSLVDCCGFIARGRIRNKRGYNATFSSPLSHHFEVKFKDARQHSMKMVDLDDNSNKKAHWGIVGDLFEGKLFNDEGYNLIVLEASHFDKSCSKSKCISSMVLYIVCKKDKIDQKQDKKVEKKEQLQAKAYEIPNEVVLFRGKVNFIHPFEYSSSDSDSEVLVDEIVLMEAMNSIGSTKGSPKNEQKNEHMSKTKDNQVFTKIGDELKLVKACLLYPSWEFIAIFFLSFSYFYFPDRQFFFMGPILLLVSLIILDVFEFKIFLDENLFLLFGHGLDQCSESKNINELSFFVNSYNAWGFCGSIMNGFHLPLYGMPHLFVKAFHNGSPALNINQMGQGSPLMLFLSDIVSRLVIYMGYGSISASTYNKKRGDIFNSMSPSLASDMFSILVERVHRNALVYGFIGQKQQFNCVAVNKSYDRLFAICGCDGVQVLESNKHESQPSSSLLTDWLFIQNIDDVDIQDPLIDYYDTAGVYNRAKLVQPMYCHPPYPAGQSIGFEQNKSMSTNINKNSQSKHAPSTPPTGWCSWYHYFEKITEKSLIENIQQMRNLKEHNGLHAERQGFNLFQIDDGYQRAWGDWLILDETKFPSGSLTTVVDVVKGAGMTAGLWMAPFSCDKHSFIVKNHPNWILRTCGSYPNSIGVNNKPSNSANCGKFFYGLDITNPEFQEYIFSVLQTVTKSWGFSYLKLDFLYSAVLPDAFESYHDRTKTRAQCLHNAMSLVSKAVEDNDIFLLGCGAPMGCMIGHVHANRVSPDAGLSWFPEFPLPVWDKWNLPSARGMIRNTLARMQMHGRWWINDPDCMLLRKTIAFSNDEIIGIATIKAASGGSFILSDDLASVPLDRMRIAQQLIPATNLPATVIDIFDQEMPELLRLHLSDEFHHWTLFTACHWGENCDVIDEFKSHRITLHQFIGKNSKILSELEVALRYNNVVTLHMIEFWTQEYHALRVYSNDSNPMIELPSVKLHSAALLAIRLHAENQIPCATYLGSNLHFSCGLEVKSKITKKERYQPSSSSSSSICVDHLQGYCCTITFQEGVIRESSWNGQIWICLPVNITETDNNAIFVDGNTADISTNCELISVTCNGGSVFRIPVGKREREKSDESILKVFW